MSYRATPNPATGKSHAELLLGRKVRTKIPDLTPNQTVSDVDVRQHVIWKPNPKSIPIRSKKAVLSDILIGDEVLLKRDQISNKSDTLFYADQLVVLKKQGSQVTVRSLDGREYVRNSSHLKAYKRAHKIIMPPLVGKKESVTILI